VPWIQVNEPNLSDEVFSVGAGRPIGKEPQGGEAALSTARRPSGKEAELSSAREPTAGQIRKKKEGRAIVGTGA
jgi:hypothetical protein